jgi:hypothetical protein
MHDITGNPDAGVVNSTLEELQKQPPSYLFEEQEAQLRKAQVVFNLFYNLPQKEIRLTALLHYGQMTALSYGLGGSKVYEQLHSQRSEIPRCSMILHALEMVLNRPVILSWLYAVASMTCRLHIV